MKTIKLLFAGLLVVAAGNSSFAQSQNHEAKEIKKEVNVEEVNGETVLTITTIADGNKTVEEYVGAEAEEKLEEMKKMTSGTTKTMVIGDDGEQHMKVEKRIVVTEEIEEDDE